MIRVLRVQGLGFSGVILMSGIWGYFLGWLAKDCCELGHQRLREEQPMAACLRAPHGMPGPQWARSV